MIFKPNTTARMWDTWLFYHASRHYLFYLHNSRADARWDGISVAISEDGVHFVDHGPILHKADDAVWLGTGMVWQVGAQFMLNFSEERNGVQEIFFAESDDLLHWRRLPDKEYVCRSEPRWYADQPTFSSHRWDCIWVLPRDDGPGYRGFLTAVANDGPPGLCGTAGCVVSDDGRHFRAAPPVIETGLWGDKVEVGAVEQIGDHHYLLLGVYELPLGARHMARQPAGESGMFVLKSERQVGPYRLAADQPLLLGSSPTPYTYFARFYRHGDELLLNHHTVARKWGDPIFFAPLKAVHCDAAGVLTLRWWAANQVLKGSPRPVVLDGCSVYGLQLGQWEVEDGRLRLTAAAAGLAILPVKYDLVRGVILEADLAFQSVHGPLNSLGLFIEGQPANNGTVLLAQSDGRLAVGTYNGYAFKPEDAKPLPFAPGRSTHWRLLLRDTHLELYVDDALIQCYTLAHMPSGRLGLVIEAGTATVENVRVWEMSL